MDFLKNSGKKSHISAREVKTFRGKGHFFVPRENVINLKKRLHADGYPAGDQRQIRNKKIFEQALNFLKGIKLFKGHGQKEVKVKEKIIVSKSVPLEKKDFRKADNIEKIKEKPKRSFRLEFSLPPTWKRQVLSFGVVCLILVVPFFGIRMYKKARQVEGKILGVSTAAFQDLSYAGNLASQTDFLAAQNKFRQASAGFQEAENELNSFGGVFLKIADLVPNKARTASKLLSIGNELSQTGKIITDLLPELSEYEVNPLNSTAKSSLTDFLLQLDKKVSILSNHLSSIQSDIKGIRVNDVPEEYRNKIIIAQRELPVIKGYFEKFRKLNSILLAVLGNDRTRRYILIFQNSRELRPTGGFIGSLALVDIYKGRVENLEVPGGGVYDIAGQLQDKIISPKPLWLVNPYWNIQDSNWFADFPMSARKVMWFFEKAGGTSVDGVIAMTPRVIESLLAISGPIEMPNYRTTITEENFVQQAQYWAEIKYDRSENKPKKIIADLLPVLLKKSFNSDPKNLLKVLNSFSEMLNTRDLLLYFNDKNIQDNIKQMNWDGGLYQAEGDYLYVVSTNIGGGKTDHVIRQLIKHTVNLTPEGDFIDSVKIIRSNFGSKADYWERVKNVSYLRVYVPRGSKFISAEGFDDIPAFRYMLPDSDAKRDPDLERIERNSFIDESSNTRISQETGKEVFGNWMEVGPGETKVAVIKYKLPLKAKKSNFFKEAGTAYSLYVQRQPGVYDSHVISEFNPDKKYQLVWKSGNLVKNKNKYVASFDQASDFFYGIVVK